MANSAQAKFSMYSTILDEQEKRRKEQEDYIEQETKRANRASFGSILGTIIGTLLAPATGGASIPLTALLAGGGSRLGSEIGEQSVKQMPKLKEKDYLFGLTGEGGIRQEKSDREALRKQFNQGQNVAGITAGVSGGLFAGLGGTTSGGVAGAGTTQTVLDNVSGQAIQSQVGQNVAQQSTNLAGQGYMSNTNLMQLLGKNSQQAFFQRLQQMFGLGK